MNQKIDNFCNDLRSKINDADKRLKDLTVSAKSKTQQAKNEAKAHLQWLDNKAKEQQARAEASKAKVKAWVQEKKTITDEKIAEWKAQRQVRKLADRADDAEDYAAVAIDVAFGAVDEAERATIEAILARMDADTVQPAAAAAG
jgi:tellurite resistance protein